MKMRWMRVIVALMMMAALLVVLAAVAIAGPITVPGRN